MNTAHRLTGGRRLPPWILKRSARVSGPDFFIPVSKPFLDSLPVTDRLRTIMNSAEDYYNTSAAKDDPSKLQTLSDDYPEKRAAAEAEADQKFKELWVGAKDGSQRITLEIAGAAGLLVIAFPLAVMGMALYATWEAGKKFWGWVFSIGAGFSQEWVDAAKKNVTESLSIGVVPPKFDEAFYVSPKGYAQQIAKDLNVVRYVDDYAGPGMREHFINVTASVWRAASVDPIVREDIGKIAWSPNGWPLAYAQKTTEKEDYNSALAAETIGLAAAYDEGAPVFILNRIIAAAKDGWNEGITDAKSMRIARKFAYDGADYEDGETLVDPGGGAIAATRAYCRARIEAKRAMGRPLRHYKAWDAATLSLKDVEDYDCNPPDRNAMPTPTINDPTPASPAMLAAKAAAAQSGPSLKKTITIYAIGAALAGAVGYFVTPWVAPIPLIGSWWIARKR